MDNKVASCISGAERNINVSSVNTVTPGPPAPHDGEWPVHYENLSGTRQKLIFGAIISSFVEILGPYVQVERGLTFGNTYLSLRKASGAIRNTRKHLKRT